MDFQIVALLLLIKNVKFRDDNSAGEMPDLAPMDEWLLDYRMGKK